MFAAKPRAPLTTLAVVAVLGACSGGQPATAPTGTLALDQGGPPPPRTESPAFNLNVELIGGHGEEGFIRFRQPDDGAITVFLNTDVRHLKPGHDYTLQRAAQSRGRGCVDAGWLTIGEGPVAKAIHTNARGDGIAALWRTLSAASIGASFDIHFRVIDPATSEVVLTSRCYQFTVRGT